MKVRSTPTVGARKHGDGGHTKGKKPKLYGVWLAMRQRCSNPKHIGWKWYGARGIRVCAEWGDYNVFKEWALENGYVEGASYRQELDRIDNDGNYEPSNCQWVRPKPNRQKTRASKMLTAFGETKSMAAWVDDPRCVVTYFVLRNRTSRDGWPVEKALITPAATPGQWHQPRRAWNKGLKKS